jgi:hypothetical protein
LFFKSYIYEVMWKNIVEPGRPQITIWRMRITCWNSKYTNTHPEYVTPIAFPLQQCLHERDSVLRYPYIACLVTMKAECVYWAVRTDSLTVIQVELSSIERPHHGSSSWLLASHWGGPGSIPCQSMWTGGRSDTGMGFYLRTVSVTSPCSIPISILILLLSDGQAGEAQDPADTCNSQQYVCRKTSRMRVGVRPSFTTRSW